MRLETRRLFAPIATLPHTGALRFVVAALAVWKERRALSRLDQDRLDDLGLTCEDVLKETAKPVWDVPAHWRG